MDSHFKHYFIFRREYEPALLKTGHERVVEIEPRLWRVMINSIIFFLPPSGDKLPFLNSSLH